MAYKRADREHIEDRIVYSDYERGRTDKSFKPRRYGGLYPRETRTMPAWQTKEISTFKENR